MDWRSRHDRRDKASDTSPGGVARTAQSSMGIPNGKAKRFGDAAATDVRQMESGLIGREVLLRSVNVEHRRPE